MSPGLTRDVQKRVDRVATCESLTEYLILALRSEERYQALISSSQGFKEKISLMNSQSKFDRLYLGAKQQLSTQTSLFLLSVLIVCFKS